jgi:hypothetical protein
MIFNSQNLSLRKHGGDIKEAVHPEQDGARSALAQCFRRTFWRPAWRAVLYEDLHQSIIRFGQLPLSVPSLFCPGQQVDPFAVNHVVVFHRSCNPPSPAIFLNVCVDSLALVERSNGLE